MTVAMIQGEPAIVCWRERDVEAALSAAADMGLPVATSWSVAEAAGSSFRNWAASLWGTWAGVANGGIRDGLR